MEWQRRYPKEEGAIRAHEGHPQGPDSRAPKETPWQEQALQGSQTTPAI